MTMENLKKLNKRPLKIYDYPLSGDAGSIYYFNFRGRHIYLRDVVRAHYNPWIEDVYPEQIHGIVTGYSPIELYVELIPGINDTVNVYGIK